MLPREVIRQVRRLQLRARRAVEDLLGGEYRSVFKGTGIAFEEVREYQPGDDIRAIDWNVTARMGHPFIKRFVEERELTVVLLVDCSASNQFGTRQQPKREVAAELAAILAFSAITNNDRVGLVAFTDRVEKFVPPRKGTRHVLRLIRDVLFFQPAHRGTCLREALEYLNRVLHGRGPPRRPDPLFQTPRAAAETRMKPRLINHRAGFATLPTQVTASGGWHALRYSEGRGNSHTPRRTPPRLIPLLLGFLAALFW